MRRDFFNKLALALSHLHPANPVDEGRLNTLIQRCFDFANASDIELEARGGAVIGLTRDYANFKATHATTINDPRLYDEIEQALAEVRTYCGERNKLE